MTCLIPSDFSILTIDGFSERMEQLRAHLTPKLQAIGDELAPILEEELSRSFYVHVARHMRRKVHPPKDTWVALSEQPRGYKMGPHFEFGLFSQYFFARVGVLYEAKDRRPFAAATAAQADTLDACYHVIFDHLTPTPPSDANGNARRFGIAAALERKRNDVLVERRFSVKEMAGTDAVALLATALNPLITLYEASTAEGTNPPHVRRIG